MPKRFTPSSLFAYLLCLQAAFTCIATICLSDSQYSRQILEMDAARGQSSVAITSSRPHSTTTATQQPFLFSLLSKSITHANLGVRYSALQLVRALTRALTVLRTGLVDTDVPMKIIEVVSGGLGEIDREGNVAKEKVTGETEMSEQTEHRAVIIAALMALCNLVNDYAPFREVCLGSSEPLSRLTYWF
jgi:armadillo repeat-containing protein 8